MWRKISLFNGRYLTIRKHTHIHTGMNLNPYLLSYTNVNSKWMIDTKAKLKNIKILEENIRHFLIVS